MLRRPRADRRLVALLGAIAILGSPWRGAAGSAPVAGPDASVPGPASAERSIHEIVRRFDLPYAGDSNPRHRLDLYLPAAPTTTPLPVVLYLHSGGWISGDKSEGARFLEPLVATGRFAGVSAGYRLADEARWPAQLHDVQAALRWVRANAAHRGLDPERIAVRGWSAGGHLALMLGTTADLSELDGRLGPHAGESRKVTAVVNQAGITDLLAIEAAPLPPGRRGPRSFEARLLGAMPRGAVERAREASPTTHVSTGDAPVLTLHGTADRTVPYDQAVRLHRALHAARVPNTLLTALRGGHVHLPRRAEERVTEFLAHWLRLPPASSEDSRHEALRDSRFVPPLED
jgi:acetyl esterase/lipase